VHERAERLRDTPAESSATGASPLLAAVRGCGVGLWSIGADGVFHADKTLLAIVGRSVEELSHEPAAPRAFVAPEDHALLPSVFGGVREISEAREAVFRVVRPDGTLRWVLCRRHMGDERSTSDEIAGIMLDITELRRGEEHRGRTRAVDTVATLAARLAHDFNNLLFAILGNATLALGTMHLPLEHPIRESLREIERAATRASDIVQRMSAFARPVQPRRQLLKLGTLVDAAVRGARDSVPPNVTVQSQPSSGEPPVLVDPRLVHELVTCLLSNAVQACESRVGAVQLEVEELTVARQAWALDVGLAPGRYLELRVTDTGHGMDAATMQRALEPFFSTRPKGGGMGLGLSIAQSVLRSHQGALRIESAPDRGTTVHAYFPLA
jgi:signal transduction histidine kinase